MDALWVVPKFSGLVMPKIRQGSSGSPGREQSDLNEGGLEHP